MTGVLVYPSLVDYLLEVDGVRKAFPGVVALNGVSLRVRPGTVHAIMGENGAGKSTLMNIITGLSAADAGVVTVRGRVAMIHQELQLMPSMTVAENIWIGREPLTALGFVSHRALVRKTREFLARLRIDLDPESRVGDLSIAGRQMVEIARALSYDADIVVMDEPTSTLSEHDAERVFAVIAELKALGRGVIYITHRIHEVFAVADEVSVLRDGQLVGSDRVDRFDRERLIAMMVGRELTHLFPKGNTPTDRVALSVRRLSLDGIFSDVSFDVHAGEILGIAGLIGSRRTELAETIFGVRRATSGEIAIEGVPVHIDSPSAAMARGMAFLTEDRKVSGLLTSLAVQENMEVAILKGPFLRMGFVRQSALDAVCETMAATLRVKTASMSALVQHLSGGNQQKVLIGRWLLTAPRVLILDEPTRGIDVGAKADIHQLISNLAAQGAAVVMISSEMPEILGMSDRVLVMRGGCAAGILERDGANQIDLMRLAAH